MKKLALTLAICLTTIYTVSAQILPSIEFGAKGGLNLTNLSKNGTFNTGNQAGYLAGFWARLGALGFNFQPEVYLTDKNVSIADNGAETRANFTSIDVPLLFGGKVGAFGLGGRFYTGPVVSFAISKDQSYSNAAGNIIKLNYQDQNYAWQVGAGLDIRSLSVDLRYEAGLSKQDYGTGSTHINLFSLSLGYKLF
jgi:hypothetical protein